jgi:hypothetical protein
VSKQPKQPFELFPGKAAKPAALEQSGGIIIKPGAIFTASFGGWKQLAARYGIEREGGLRHVSIACWTPRWFGACEHAPELKPPAEFLKRAQAGRVKGINAYWREYWSLCLHDLKAKEIVKLYAGSILFCHCKPNQPCHRRLLAEWLEHFGKTTITEVGFVRKDVTNYITW